MGLDTKARLGTATLKEWVLSFIQTGLSTRATGKQASRMDLEYSSSQMEAGMKVIGTEENIKAKESTLQQMEPNMSECQINS